jgi:hypothetical protein
MRLAWTHSSPLAQPEEAWPLGVLVAFLEDECGAQLWTTQRDVAPFRSALLSSIKAIASISNPVRSLLASTLLDAGHSAASSRLLGDSSQPDPGRGPSHPLFLRLGLSSPRTRTHLTRLLPDEAELEWSEDVLSASARRFVRDPVDVFAVSTLMALVLSKQVSLALKAHAIPGGSADACNASLASFLQCVMSGEHELLRTAAATVLEAVSGSVERPAKRAKSASQAQVEPKPQAVQSFASDEPPRGRKRPRDEGTTLLEQALSSIRDASLLTSDADQSSQRSFSSTGKWLWRQTGEGSRPRFRKSLSSICQLAAGFVPCSEAMTPLFQPLLLASEDESSREAVLVAIRGVLCALPMHGLSLSERVLPDSKPWAVSMARSLCAFSMSPKASYAVSQPVRSSLAAAGAGMPLIALEVLHEALASAHSKLASDVLGAWISVAKAAGEPFASWCIGASTRIALADAAVAEAWHNSAWAASKDVEHIANAIVREVDECMTRARQSLRALGSSFKTISRRRHRRRGSESSLDEEEGSDSDSDTSVSSSRSSDSPSRASHSSEAAAAPQAPQSPSLTATAAPLRDGRQFAFAHNAEFSPHAPGTLNPEQQGVYEVLEAFFSIVAPQRSDPNVFFHIDWFLTGIAFGDMCDTALVALSDSTVPLSELAVEASRRAASLQAAACEQMATTLRSVGTQAYTSLVGEDAIQASSRGQSVLQRAKERVEQFRSHLDADGASAAIALATRAGTWPKQMNDVFQCALQPQRCFSALSDAPPNWQVGLALDRFVFALISVSGSAFRSLSTDWLRPSAPATAEPVDAMLSSAHLRLEGEGLEAAYLQARTITDTAQPALGSRRSEPVRRGRSGSVDQPKARGFSSLISRTRAMLGTSASPAVPKSEELAKPRARPTVAAVRKPRPEEEPLRGSESRSPGLRGIREGYRLFHCKETSEELTRVLIIGAATLIGMASGSHALVEQVRGLELPHEADFLALNFRGQEHNLTAISGALEGWSECGHALALLLAKHVVLKVAQSSSSSSTLVLPPGMLSLSRGKAESCSLRACMYMHFEPEAVPILAKFCALPLLCAVSGVPWRAPPSLIVTQVERFSLLAPASAENRDLDAFSLDSVATNGDPIDPPDVVWQGMLASIPSSTEAVLAADSSGMTAISVPAKLSKALSALEESVESGIEAGGGAGSPHARRWAWLRAAVAAGLTQPQSTLKGLWNRHVLSTGSSDVERALAVVILGLIVGSLDVGDDASAPSTAPEDPSLASFGFEYSGSLLNSLMEAHQQHASSASAGSVAEASLAPSPEWCNAITGALKSLSQSARSSKDPDILQAAMMVSTQRGTHWDFADSTHALPGWPAVSTPPLAVVGSGSSARGAPKWLLRVIDADATVMKNVPPALLARLLLAAHELSPESQLEGKLVENVRPLLGVPSLCASLFRLQRRIGSLAEPTTDPWAALTEEWQGVLASLPKVEHANSMIAFLLGQALVPGNLLDWVTSGSEGLMAASSAPQLEASPVTAKTLRSVNAIISHLIIPAWGHLADLGDLMIRAHVSGHSPPWTLQAFERASSAPGVDERTLSQCFGLALVVVLAIGRAQHAPHLVPFTASLLAHATPRHRNLILLSLIPACTDSTPGNVPWFLRFLLVVLSNETASLVASTAWVVPDGGAERRLARLLLRSDLERAEVSEEEVHVSGVEERPTFLSSFAGLWVAAALAKSTNWGDLISGPILGALAHNALAIDGLVYGADASDMLHATLVALLASVVESASRNPSPPLAQALFTIASTGHADPLDRVLGGAVDGHQLCFRLWELRASPQSIALAALANSPPLMKALSPDQSAFCDGLKKRSSSVAGESVVLSALKRLWTDDALRDKLRAWTDAEELDTALIEALAAETEPQGVEPSVLVQGYVQLCGACVLLLTFAPVEQVARTLHAAAVRLLDVAIPQHTAHDVLAASSGSALDTDGMASLIARLLGALRSCWKVLPPHAVPSVFAWLEEPGPSAEAASLVRACAVYHTVERFPHLFQWKFCGSSILPLSGVLRALARDESLPEDPAVVVHRFVASRSHESNVVIEGMRTVLLVLSLELEWEQLHHLVSSLGSLSSSALACFLSVALGHALGVGGDGEDAIGKWMERCRPVEAVRVLQGPLAVEYDLATRYARCDVGSPSSLLQELDAAFLWASERSNRAALCDGGRSIRSVAASSLTSVALQVAVHAKRQWEASRSSQLAPSSRYPRDAWALSVSTSDAVGPSTSQWIVPYLDSTLLLEPSLLGFPCQEFLDGVALLPDRPHLVPALAKLARESPLVSSATVAHAVGQFVRLFPSGEDTPRADAVPLDVGGSRFQLLYQASRSAPTPVDDAEDEDDEEDEHRICVTDTLAGGANPLCDVVKARVEATWRSSSSEILRRAESGNSIAAGCRLLLLLPPQLRNGAVLGCGQASTELRRRLCEVTRYLAEGRRTSPLGELVHCLWSCFPRDDSFLLLFGSSQRSLWLDRLAAKHVAMPETALPPPELRIIPRVADYLQYASVSRPRGSSSRGSILGKAQVAQGSKKAFFDSIGLGPIEGLAVVDDSAPLLRDELSESLPPAWREAVAGAHLMQCVALEPEALRRRLDSLVSVLTQAAGEDMNRFFELELLLYVAFWGALSSPGRASLISKLVSKKLALLLEHVQHGQLAAWLNDWQRLYTHVCLE